MIDGLLDIITVAKGIGNGFPMAGVLISPMFKPVYGQLGTTFGGNHLACSAALAVMDVIEQENLVENAAKVGNYTATSVSALNFVQNQDSAGFCASFAEFLHKFGSRYLDPSYTLYSFNDNGTYISPRQFLLHGFDVVQRKINNMTVVVNRCNDRRIVGHHHRSQRNR